MRRSLRAALGSGHAQSTVIALFRDNLVVEHGRFDDSSASDRGAQREEERCNLHVSFVLYEARRVSERAWADQLIKVFVLVVVFVNGRTVRRK